MPAQLAYVYDGSFDGLLTAVFEAYRRREAPDVIAPQGTLQSAFGQEVAEIPSDETKARRVEAGVLRSLGDCAYQTVWTVYLSCDPDKDTKIYRYLRHGFSMGRRFYSDLAHDDVLAVNRLLGNVQRERERMMQFLRFSLVEGGVYYARIAPKHDILPLIMPHFVDRYSVQPFLIHDAAHNLAGVYDLERWELVETRGVTLPETDPEEIRVRRLWKKFYDTIEIKERHNPRCRRTMMPKRFWKNMTEHNGSWMERERAAKDHRVEPPKIYETGS